MASKLFADVVVGIPFGNEGRKRWNKVGVILKMDTNDASKGPGFVIMLDKTFNPAGVIGSDSSIALSTYWPKEHEAAPRSTTPYKAPATGPAPDLDDDDIPF